MLSEFKKNRYKTIKIRVRNLSNCLNPPVKVFKRAMVAVEADYYFPLAIFNFRTPKMSQWRESLKLDPGPISTCMFFVIWALMHLLE